MRRGFTGMALAFAAAAAVPAGAAPMLFELTGEITEQVGGVAFDGNRSYVGQSFAGTVLFDPDKPNEFMTQDDRISPITIGDRLTIDTPTDRAFSSLSNGGDRFIGILPFNPVTFGTAAGSLNCAGSGGVTITGASTMRFSLGCVSGAVRIGGTGSYRPAGNSAPAVPEPATWLTMILGFAAIGHALRRRTILRYV